MLNYEGPDPIFTDKIRNYNLSLDAISQKFSTLASLRAKVLLIYSSTRYLATIIHNMQDVTDWVVENLQSLRDEINNLYILCTEISNAVRDVDSKPEKTQNENEMIYTFHQCRNHLTSLRTRIPSNRPNVPPAPEPPRPPTPETVDSAYENIDPNGESCCCCSCSIS